MGSIRHGGRPSPRVSLESVAPDVFAAIAAAESRDPRRRPHARRRRDRWLGRRFVAPSVSLLLVGALAATVLFVAGAARQPQTVAALASGATHHPAAATALTLPPPSVEPTFPQPVDPARLSGYVWPLPQGRVTLPFGPTDWGEFFDGDVRIHDGIDMATFCGDQVHAAHSGVVLTAGRQFDDFLGWRGNLSDYKAYLDQKHLWGSLPITVVIDDGNGYRSIYAHFYEVTVEAGDVVSAGDVIGYEGATGNASGCHVHYGLFSPLEQKSFGLDPELIEHLKLPLFETARVDPLLVLPYRADVDEMHGLRTPPPAPTPAQTGPER